MIATLAARHDTVSKTTVAIGTCLKFWMISCATKFDRIAFICHFWSDTCAKDEQYREQIAQVKMYEYMLEQTDT